MNPSHAQFVLVGVVLGKTPSPSQRPKNDWRKTFTIPEDSRLEMHIITISDACHVQTEQRPRPDTVSMRSLKVE